MESEWAEGEVQTSWWWTFSSIRVSTQNYYCITSHEKERDCIWGQAIKPVKHLEENVEEKLHVNALSDDATAELLFMEERQLQAPITCCDMQLFNVTLTSTGNII